VLAPIEATVDAVASPEVTEVVDAVAPPLQDLLPPSSQPAPPLLP
jgi:hypothetical protein